jgi:transposase
VLTDGAEWIKNQVDLHFPGAIHIIDFYHAREHLARLAQWLFPGHPNQVKTHEQH